MNTAVARDQRRGAERHENRRNAVIKAGRTFTPMPCIVEDISHTGARLQVRSGNHVPDFFMLQFDGIEGDIDCVVVRRKETEVGVIFERAPLLR